MAIIYACSMDHYGPLAAGVSGSGNTRTLNIGNNSLLGDGWTKVPDASTGSPSTATVHGDYSIGVPPWGARQGKYALLAHSTGYDFKPSSFSNVTHDANPTTNGVWMNIPGASAAKRLIHFAFSLSDLPPEEITTGHIVEFMTAGMERRATLAVTPTGRLRLLDGVPRTVRTSDYGVNQTTTLTVQTSPATLLVTQAPVIQAQTWHFMSIEIEIDVHGDADIAVYLGDISPANLVLSGSGLSFTPDPIHPNGYIDGLNFLPVSYRGEGVQLVNAVFTDDITRAVRDIVICDDSGTYNNALLGECFVAAQEMRMEEPGGGWEANPRQKVAGGVFQTRRLSGTARTELRFADHASMEIGASDFTLEGWFRFSSIPLSTDVWNLVAKWFTDTANRSYRLVYYGSDKTFRWEASANGSAGITVKQVPFEVVKDRWYHVAVSRESGSTHLFIDGVEYGAGTADANTYHNGTAYLGVGCRFSGTLNNPVLAEDFNGFIDEVRLSVGVSRYTSDFVPSTVPFGRNATDDPDFATVGLLLGWDNNDNVDESVHSHQPLSVTGRPAPLPPLNPEDGDYTFRVLNGAPPIDDTFIEAPYTHASGMFVFLGLPVANDTITVGSQTYTWVASVSTANDIAIGADIDECIDNLVSAVNAGAGAGTKYGTGTTANADAAADSTLSPQVIFIATVLGSSGNAVDTLTTSVTGKWLDSTLTGGKDIPAPSDFAIERLPVDVTGILGVQMTTRSYKTDAGTAKMRLDLVGPGGGVEQGAEVSPDLNPQWGRQIFEEDPDTSAGITPSTLIGGRVRFTRTA